MRALRCAYGALTVGLTLALTGCGFLIPSTPNDSPLAMTVRDGQVWFRWCGSKSVEDNFIRIDYARYDPERSDELAAQGSGSFSLSRGDEFSTEVGKCQGG